MLAMALMSPVLTSIRIATPYMPSISLSFCTRAFSQKSCMLTSRVVWTSAPATAGRSTTGRYIFMVFTLCDSPGMPLSRESNCFCSPVRPCPVPLSTSPSVRAASEPKGFSIFFCSSVCSPVRLRDRLKNGIFLISL
jgi:hypothetical protein